MPSRLKVFVQYVIILGITSLLIWVSLRGLHTGNGDDKWGYLKHTWQSADKMWLLIMAAIALVSHAARRLGCALATASFHSLVRNQPTGPVRVPAAMRACNTPRSPSRCRSLSGLRMI